MEINQILIFIIYSRILRDFDFLFYMWILFWFCYNKHTTKWILKQTNKQANKNHTSLFKAQCKCYIIQPEPNILLSWTLSLLLVPFAKLSPRSTYYCNCLVASPIQPGCYTLSTGIEPYFCGTNVHHYIQHTYIQINTCWLDRSLHKLTAK